jgi:hypothetical protein
LVDTTRQFYHGTLWKTNFKLVNLKILTPFNSKHCWNTPWVFLYIMCLFFARIRNSRCLPLQCIILKYVPMGKWEKKISEKINLIEPKLYVNNLGMIYYNNFNFCFDWKIKMATVTGKGFKIEHMGKWKQS